MKKRERIYLKTSSAQKAETRFYKRMASDMSAEIDRMILNQLVKKSWNELARTPFKRVK